ncbi:MAG: CDP-diacylglycerol--glycerol-3-phosphate 3-phosphatidyltransferase [Clostridiales Family XIII bacterium]|jgi:CDP-diacylglycerol--glycerol-3-phosphate 3-phosphatidyltransferase|nr:CDP-diacylglycerol--glycerol-3-phosphate 3-phosphatidyltransferase [Clostridiales Family XIII bacterium]
MKNKNLPNQLTMLRVVMIPVFIVCLMTGHAVISAVIFAAAAATDALDGHIARKYNLISNFGKLMDPLADKLLVVSALVCLVELGEIPAWMVIVILAREFTITGLRSVAASEGVVIAAGFSGKLKTVFQMLAILAILLENRLFSLSGIPFARIMLWIAVLLTLYSGIEYIVKGRALFTR